VVELLPRGGERCEAGGTIPRLCGVVEGLTGGPAPRLGRLNLDAVVSEGESREAVVAEGCGSRPRRGRARAIRVGSR
jgi:hypothetical protein